VRFHNGRFSSYGEADGVPRAPQESLHSFRRGIFLQGKDRTLWDWE